MSSFLIKILGKRLLKRIPVTIDPGRLLPSELVISGAEEHLYRIGLSLFECESGIKRKSIYNPKLVFIVYFIHFIRSFVFIYFGSELSEEVHLYLGDGDYLLNGKNLINALCFVTGIMSLLPQYLNYSNFKNGLKPVDLRVFKMVSGLVTPQSVGLEDSDQIIDFVLKFKICLKIITKSIQSIVIIFFFVGIILYIPRYTVIQIIVITIPNIVFWQFWLNYVHASLFFHMFYYFFLTYYLKLKLKTINSRLIKIRKLANYSIGQIIKDLADFCIEVDECNTIYWSQYLFIIWLTLGSIISMLVFLTLFIEEGLTMIKILFLNIIATDLTLLLLVIAISSEIYSEIEKCFKRLNSCYSNRKMSLYMKLKVN